MSWSDDQLLPIPAPNVIFRRLPDGAVIYSSESEIYFGLNEVGACIWELLPPACHTLGDMCAELSRAHPDATSGLIRRDVMRHLDELLTNALVALKSP